jgi:hypothetical protein
MQSIVVMLDVALSSQPVDTLEDTSAPQTDGAPVQFTPIPGSDNSSSSGSVESVHSFHQAMQDSDSSEDSEEATDTDSDDDVRKIKKA